ncbi:MAG: M23 family metallopeptidase [Bdellovibrionales bacterium]|nr:M23 family metallopeptidase [Bdellovibrionales bacterium]
MASTNRIVSLKFVVFLFFVAMLVPVAIAGWSRIAPFLEYNSPQITVTEMLRGIGRTPVSMRIELRDDGAGLDEVVIRTQQRGTPRLLLRKNLNGEKRKQVSIEFLGDKSDLEEGTAFLEIRAFDRSFWSNRAEVSIPLEVDYRKPKIEVITTQHNAAQGGSQLIFYRAYDESLAVSGVKVGNQTFLGFPARGIDNNFEDPAVFLALYASELGNDPQNISVRAFAEDRVGNATSVSFYNKIQARSWREITIKLTESYLRENINELANVNFYKMREFAGRGGENLDFKTPKGSNQRLIEQFSFVNTYLRQMSDAEISGLLKGPRFERYFEGPFSPQEGSLRSIFGDKITYTFDGVVAGRARSNGYEYSMPKEHSDVIAANSGVVIFSENIGTYGRVIAIDHGLGLTSLYAWLDHTLVNKGDTVKIGQKIGAAGTSGLSPDTRVYFELRLHGVPVDPREWLDKRWYYSHITAKINEVKKIMGIPIYRRLGEL